MSDVYKRQESDSVVFCVDYALNGIGSNSCGPVVLEQYRFDDVLFRFPGKKENSIPDGIDPPHHTLRTLLFHNRCLLYTSPIDHITIQKRFLSRSTMSFTRSTIASSHALSLIHI